MSGGPLASVASRQRFEVVVRFNARSGWVPFVGDDGAPMPEGEAEAFAAAMRGRGFAALLRFVGIGAPAGL